MDVAKTDEIKALLCKAEEARKCLCLGEDPAFRAREPLRSIRLLHKCDQSGKGRSHRIVQSMPMRARVIHACEPLQF